MPIWATQIFTDLYRAIQTGTIVQHFVWRIQNTSLLFKHIKICHSVNSDFLLSFLLALCTVALK